MDTLWGLQHLLDSVEDHHLTQLQLALANGQESEQLQIQQNVAVRHFGLLLQDLLDTLSQGKMFQSRSIVRMCTSAGRDYQRLLSLGGSY